MDDDEARAKWHRAIARDIWRERRLAGDPCRQCGQVVGHFGGSVERDPCGLIEQDVPLEEVRPNCYAVRRDWIGDAIRHAEKRGRQ